MEFSDCDAVRSLQTEGDGALLQNQGVLRIGFFVFLPLADVGRQVRGALTGLTTKHALDKPRFLMKFASLSESQTRHVVSADSPT